MVTVEPPKTGRDTAILSANKNNGRAVKPLRFITSHDASCPIPSEITPGATWRGELSQSLGYPSGSLTVKDFCPTITSPWIEEIFSTNKKRTGSPLLQQQQKERRPCYRDVGIPE